MSTAVKEILGWSTFIAIIWDTVMTFFVLVWIRQIRQRIFRLENPQKDKENGVVRSD